MMWGISFGIVYPLTARFIIGGPFVDATGVLLGSFEDDLDRSLSLFEDDLGRVL